NGTATLLQLDCGSVAVTCYHVLKCYKQRRDAGENCLCWIGECRIDPVSQCIAMSEGADLAVLGLTDAQRQQMTTAGSIGAQFFVPTAWPPKRVAAGEDVVFCGFPGQWRLRLDFDSLEFASYSQGSRVSDVSNNSFICECRREFWQSESGKRSVDSL